MTPVVMPQIGENLRTGHIVEWLKQENDPVEKGEVVLAVESEKAVFEVEAETSGVLAKILHQAGEEVEVFATLAYIGRPGEVFEEQEEAPAEKVAAPAGPLAAPPLGAGSRPRTFASPSARRLARELKVDLVRVQGSGPGGRIVKRDILAAASTAAPGDRIVPFGRLRQRIAERMTLSKQTIPHFYLFADVDMTAALTWREQVKGGSGVRISITALIIRAAARALRQFERMNAHVEMDRLILKEGIHIGVATAVDDGLLVPVVAEADKKSVVEIDAICRENAAAAGRGAVKPHPEATFTITNLGMYDITRFLPIINPPECAMLAVGAVEERVVSMDRAIGVRQVMTLTLACDHRGVDGTYAARFLNRVKHFLENLDFVSTTEETT